MENGNKSQEAPFKFEASSKNSIDFSTKPKQNAHYAYSHNTSDYYDINNPNDRQGENLPQLIAKYKSVDSTIVNDLERKKSIQKMNTLSSLLNEGVLTLPEVEKNRPKQPPSLLSSIGVRFALLKPRYQIKYPDGVPTHLQEKKYEC